MYLYSYAQRWKSWTVIKNVNDAILPTFLWEKLFDNEKVSNKCLKIILDWSSLQNPSMISILIIESWLPEYIPSWRIRYVHNLDMLPFLPILLWENLVVDSRFCAVSHVQMSVTWQLFDMSKKKLFLASITTRHKKFSFVLL